MSGLGFNTIFPGIFGYFKYIEYGNDRLWQRQMSRQEWKMFSHLERKRNREARQNYVSWLRWVGKNI